MPPRKANAFDYIFLSCLTIGILPIALLIENIIKRYRESKMEYTFSDDIDIDELIERFKILEEKSDRMDSRVEKYKRCISRIHYNYSDQDQLPYDWFLAEFLNQNFVGLTERARTEKFRGAQWTWMS